MEYETQQQTKPFYKSSGVMAGLMAAVAAMSGVDMQTFDFQAIMDNLNQIVAAGMALYAAYGRMTATTQVGITPQSPVRPSSNFTPPPQYQRVPVPEMVEFPPEFQPQPINVKSIPLGVPARNLNQQVG